ncbi:hypothetical protein LXL04_008996 [Taraxacum kok-saghyz]
MLLRIHTRLFLTCVAFIGIIFIGTCTDGSRPSRKSVYCLSLRRRISITGRTEVGVTFTSPGTIFETRNRFTSNRHFAYILRAATSSDTTINLETTINALSLPQVDEKDGLISLWHLYRCLSTASIIDLQQ